MNITLDHNCLIDIEEKREAAPFLKSIIALHNNTCIRIRVLGIGASELKPNLQYASNFSEFQQKINNVGLEKIDILKPFGIIGITFWDWGLWADDKMENLAENIHEILFPKIEFSYKNYCEKRDIRIDENKLDKKWVNVKCDVMSMWSHIYYNGDIFVTRDSNFHNEEKKNALINIGAKEILYPIDVYERLKKHLKEYE